MTESELLQVAWIEPGEVSVAKRIRILIVEDDALSRKFFATVVRERLPDAEICEAMNVALARSTLRDGGADLVITDIHLGDGHGTDVLLAVRVSTTPRASVVAVTGVSGAEADDLRRKGFDDILVKPVNLADLRAVLQRELKIE